MPNVTFIALDGTPQVVDVPAGKTLMEAAVGELIPGIVAECGGACACATCHVYVDEAWSERVGPPSDLEAQMLDVLEIRRPTSRLSCQIRMTEALDGVVLEIPETQG
jgi:ferredoxin, 2Fe-2S